MYSPYIYVWPVFFHVYSAHRVSSSPSHKVNKLVVNTTSLLPSPLLHLSFSGRSSQFRLAVGVVNMPSKSVWAAVLPRRALYAAQFAQKLHERVALADMVTALSSRWESQHRPHTVFSRAHKRPVRGSADAIEMPREVFKFSERCWTLVRALDLVTRSLSMSQSS